MKKTVNPSNRASATTQAVSRETAPADCANLPFSPMRSRFVSYWFLIAFVLVACGVVSEASAQGTAPTGITLSVQNGNTFLPTVVETENVVVIGAQAAFTVGSGTLSTDTVVTVSVGGTATAGTDYDGLRKGVRGTLLDGFTLTIPANMTSSTILVLQMPGTNDMVAEGDETVVFSGMADGFTVKSATLTIIDNDTATVILGDVMVGEDAASGTVTVTARLDNAVQGGFTVMAVTADGTATTGSDYTTTTTMLTFAGEASETETFTVPIIDDGDVEGVEMFTVALPELTGTAVPVVITDTATVTITDDDIGLVLTPASLTLDEGANTTYSVALSTLPTDDVMVTIMSDNVDVTFAPPTLTFTATNGQMPQSVTVTAGEDDDVANDVATLTHTAAGGDYAGITADLAVTVTDNDIGLVLTPASLTLDEGATTTYSVALSTLPTDDVMVTIASDNTDVTPAPTTLTFTTTDWATPQTVTLTAAEDDDNAANDVATLTHTAAGGDYAGITADLAVTVTDNDIGLVLTPASLTLDEGATTTYSVALSTLPTDDVMVTIVSDNPDVTFAPTTSLTFTTLNWKTPQSITVTAAEDADLMQEEVTLTHTIDSADTRYAGITDLAVTVADNDIPGLTLTPASLMLDEGATATYTAVLDTLPSADVVVTIAGHGDVTPTPPALTFTASTWNAAQTVTLTAAADTDLADDDATLAHTITSTDTAYAGLTVVNLAVTVTDTTPGLVLTPTTLTLDEGAATTYSVALSTLPTADVMVTIMSDNVDVTFAPPTLTFTATNGQMPQSVTVTAGEDTDLDRDDATLTHTITSTDTDYSNITTTDLVVTVTDNATATAATTTTQLNEQTLTRAAQVMTAGTLAAVGARVDAVAGGRGGSGKPLAYQLGGQSSLRGLLETHGKAMLEESMDYQGLLEGASFVLPLAAANSDSSGTPGALAFWGGLDSRTLAGDEDTLDWDGKVSGFHLGIDRQFSEKLMAGVALSSNQSSFDYKDTVTTTTTGEYRYNSVNLHPYFGWYPSDALRLWGTLGYGSGEIEMETDIETDAVQATDSTQLSLSGGFSRQVLNSARLSGGTNTLSVKGDVSLSSVDVEENAGFAAQEVGSTRLRVLVSGEQQRRLANGGRLMPSLEVGVRFDGGDGVTGSGVELGGGLRYANPGGKLSVAGNIRTLLAGEYDESGVDLTVRLAPQSGRGVSLSVRPVWGRTGSAAERLWNEGASEITGGDTALGGSVDTEVGYGLATTMLGSPGVLTPYTGITAQDDGTSRLRLGGRFAGARGLSLNLEGVRGNTADGASHTVLLRGEVGF